MKTIDADQAAELIFELFKAKPWLNKPGELIESDFQAMEEAIMFLQQMTLHDADSYGDTSEPARHIVVSLLHELMASLMHPESPLNKGSWNVDDSKSVAEQAFQIISAEIVDSHHRDQLMH